MCGKKINSHQTGVNSLSTANATQCELSGCTCQQGVTKLSERLEAQIKKRGKNINNQTY